MGKKKKKTVASTRPQIKEVVEIKKEKKKKLIGKLFAKKISKKKNEVKAVEKVAEEESLLKEELDKVQETAVAKDEKMEKAENSEPGKFKEKKPKKRMSPERKQKIRGGLLVLIGLFALSFIGWFLFGKFFRAQDLAEILPANETVALIEINTDGQSGQVKQFYELMKNYPVYQAAGLTNMLNLVLPIEYKTDIEPWIGRKIGMSAVNLKDKGELNRIYFIESRDHNLTIEFIKSKALKAAKEELTSEDYGGYKLYGYTLGGLFEFTFVNNYLVIAESADIMKAYIDRISKGRLSDDDSYRITANNLPQGSLISGYVDFNRLFTVLTGDSKFLAVKGQDYLALKPYLSLFRSAGITIFADKEKFVLQTFEALNKDETEGARYITYSEKYQGSLLAYAAEDPILLLAGHDLSKEINRLQEIFGLSTKGSSQLVEGLLEAQKNIYLGSEINLKNDVYPLLTGEYMLTVEGSYEAPEFGLVFDLPNGNKDSARMEKIASAFIKAGGLFTPRVQEVTLPDGTKGQEIVASAEQIEKFEEKYNGIPLTALKLGETGFNVYYTVADGKAFFATKKDKLMKMLDRDEGRVSTSLKTTGFYGKIVSPLLTTADEITLVKIGAVSEKFGLNEDKVIGPYLLPFSNLTQAKNYFTDGISTIYMLEII
jgi:hypothetical protein